ncbi:hypothetical protein ACIO1C_01220 [Streptomyces sp. NPDC087420]|uniref:hypothetical protein n=1 Tax=Streptomyces sp. NPDC087420 TaxID=3365785 RepID=UPI0038358BCF
MTITETVRPTHHRPVALARGFLTGGVGGASLAALVVGGVIENVPLFAGGLGLPVVYALLLFVAGLPRRVREAAGGSRTALAMIESSHAVGGETGDIPVQFELSVAPDDAPAFRVAMTANINLVELPDYRPRGIVVVTYRPDRPWKVRLVERPTPEWKQRAAEARIDSAPGSTLVKEPPEGCAFGFLVLVGLLLGAAAVVLSFRTDLFGDEASARTPSSSKPSVSTSSSTTVTSSAGLGTVSVGPGQSLLDRGELCRAVDVLTKGKEKDARQALTVSIQEQLLSVVFAPMDTPVVQFDVRSLPCARIPALVEEARTTLGVRAPRGWQVTVDHLTGALAVRIAVTGPNGTASLDADAKGKVVRRSPVR